MRKRGFDDVMLLDFLFAAIKGREIKLRRGWGGSLAVFCPPCGGARAVIKDWLVLMWSCCHGGILYLTVSGIDAVDPEDSPPVIYLKKNLHFPIQPSKKAELCRQYLNTTTDSSDGIRSNGALLGPQSKAGSGAGAFDSSPVLAALRTGPTGRLDHV